MKVLVLGATGMLGHKLYQVLGTQFEVVGTIRGDYRDIGSYGFFLSSGIVDGFDAMKIARVEQVIRETGPDAVVNCIGVVKSRVENAGVQATIWLNSLLPHRLYTICQEKGIRLVHISTDCVFSGNKGNYSEEDPSDAEDTYGKTKYLGEVNGAGALTIRTSLIGRELAGANGLLEWFLSNEGGRVQGYTRAVFSGFPTLHLSRIIADILKKHGDLSGIYHVAAEPIDKFSLLTLIKKTMGLNIEIEEYAGYRVDRSLDATRYREKTGFQPLSWEKMVEELAEDAVPYAKWRQDDFSK